MLRRYSVDINRLDLIRFYSDSTCKEFWRALPALAADSAVLDFERAAGVSLFFYWADINKHPAAVLMVSQFNQTSGTAEIGCAVASEWRYAGVAVEAMGTLCHELFNGNIYVQKITSTCLSSNTRARELLEYAGFKLESVLERSCYFDGKLQSERRYRLFREEFNDRYGMRFAGGGRKKLFCESENRGESGNDSASIAHGVEPQEGNLGADADADSGGGVGNIGESNREELKAPTG